MLSRCIEHGNGHIAGWHIKHKTSESTQSWGVFGHCSYGLFYPGVTYGCVGAMPLTRETYLSIAQEANNRMAHPKRPHILVVDTQMACTIQKNVATEIVMATNHRDG